MTIQDPPRHAELDRLPPEPCDCWGDYCYQCGYGMPAVDEREGDSLSEERLAWEERT